MKSFEGQVALVTGAGGGIGLAAASAFAEAGASVIMADSNTALLEEAASALRSAGHEVRAVTCDVRDRNQVRAMTEQAVKAYGRLDAAFNNAGIRHHVATATIPMLQYKSGCPTVLVLDISREGGNGRTARHRCIKEQASRTRWNATST
jgi:NAD(P)-dependent dehydrogenase (short-subunit alcohol dehydrogenase family)